MSGYIGTQPVPQATQTRDSFTATSGQTSFSTSGYTPNYLDVYLNGVKLAAADYTATNGSEVVLASGAATGDILEVVAYTTFTTADIPDGTPSIDDNGNATAMTIDSNENVLITKTATGIATVGSELKATGELLATVNNDACVFLNRKSSDGDIINLRKDGTTVGSIGVTAGDNIYFAGAAGNTKGLYLADQGVIPCTTSGVPQDGASDLGAPTVRFRHAYLSGGIYLGGAGSANKLEDYEEGTFTPFIRINNGVEGISVSHASGAYIKVGRAVHIILRWRLSSKGSNVGNVRLDGLPFTVGDRIGTTGIEGGATIGYLSGMAGTWTNVVAWPVENETEIGFSIRTGTTGDYSSMTNSNIGNLFDGRIACTYFVD
jgi:hypothetical protein